MLSTIYSVSALLLSFGILCLGHGLQNTILGVRATIENYPDWVTGLMMSGYFLGFIFGTQICTRLSPVIGHIRSFAAFASVASVVSLIHVLFVNEVVWIILRIIYGLCVAGLYVVIESWLNGLSTKENRGRILSVYMIISFISLSLGQTLILLAEPSEYILFALVSILISFSLVPITISKVKQPELSNSENFGFKRLYTISPLATIGCAVTGLTLGAFWGLGAVYFTRIGLAPNNVALVIGATFFGGLIFQWPIGYFSDLFDRKITISVVLFCSFAVCLQVVNLIGENITTSVSFPLLALALLFGGFGYTLYSLFIALANDYLEPQFIVRASGGLITFHAIGAIFGPLLAALFMTTLGHNGLFYFLATVNGITFLFSVIRIIKGRNIPEATSESFVSLPKTGTGVMDLYPVEEDAK